MRFRVGQVKTLSIEAFLVRKVVHRIGDEVDRNDVDASALDAHRRHPRRKHVAQPLDQLEDIIGPVDFVDVSGLRMSDHECGSIDPPRTFALLAYDAFGQMLGAKVGMVQLLCLLEHVFAECSFVEAGRGDRARMVKAAYLQGMRELDGVSRAVNVGELLVFGARVQVVDRGEMKHMLDLALELFLVSVADAQIGLAEIAEHRGDLLFVRVPRNAQRIEFFQRFLADEEMDGFAALEEILDQETADETSTAGDEVSHCDSSTKTFGPRSRDACVRRTSRCRESLG